MTIRYDDVGTINAVKLLPKIDIFNLSSNDYIMLYTEIDSHIEIGDNIFITLDGEIEDMTGDQITLDNYQISKSSDSLYSVETQGYTVIYVDKNKNVIVIDKLITDILEKNENINEKILGEHYISKVSCNNINFSKGEIDSTLIKDVNMNVDEIENNIIWIQSVILGGKIFETDIKDKYDSNYISQNATYDEDTKDVTYFFTLNNTIIGVSNGYSYFYNLSETILYYFSNCGIDNGNFTNCSFTNNGESITNGYFDNCEYDNCEIDGGYHKDIISLGESLWNNGFFDCDPDTGYIFDLTHWYDGVFVNGYFGSIDNSPIWHDGIFNNGIWDSYKWITGTFNNGIFGSNGNSSGTISNKLYSSYESSMGITRRDEDGNIIDTDPKKYVYTDWEDGNFNGGIIIRTNWKKGRMKNGVILDSTILNINMEDGILIDVSIRKGEIDGGYIMNKNKSTLINSCVLENCNIQYYDGRNKINGYISTQISDYFDKYVSINNINISSNVYEGVRIFINNCDLNSPNIYDTDRSIVGKSNRVFIGNQNSISGGVYENLNFWIPQTYKVDKCTNCKFSLFITKEYEEEAVSYNGTLGIFRENTYLEVTTGATDFTGITEKNIYIDLDKNDIFYTDINRNVLSVYLNSFNTSSIRYRDVNIDDPDDPIDLLSKDDNYDPKTNTGGDYYSGHTIIPYESIIKVGENFINTSLEFEEYTFGDFGFVFSKDDGKLEGNFIINGGVYNKCNFEGTLQNAIKVIINNGVFNGKLDDSYNTLGGDVEIYGGDFNNMVVYATPRISEGTHTNSWYSGNFNSGDFGKPGDNDVVYDEFVAFNNSIEYYTGITSGTTDYDGSIAGDSAKLFGEKYNLSSIHPLIITTSQQTGGQGQYNELNAFDDNLYITDEWSPINNTTTTILDYNLDLWNESGIDFNSLESGKSWSDSSYINPNTKIIPSHFVLILDILSGGTTEQRDRYLQDMIFFLDQSINVSIVDFKKEGVLDTSEQGNNLYKSFLDRYYRGEYDGNTLTKESNNHFDKYLGYKVSDTKKSISLIFRFDKIQEMYNYTGDKMIEAYDQNYKNVWSDANAGYSVRPMPTFNYTSSDEVPIYIDIHFHGPNSVNDSDDYGSYPLPTGFTGWQVNSVPPPWFYDNNNSLWYPYDEFSGYTNSGVNWLKEDIVPKFDSGYDNYLEFRSGTTTNSGLNSFYYISDTLKLVENNNYYIAKLNYFSLNVEDIIDATGPSEWLRLKVNTDIYKGGWSDYVADPIKYDYDDIVELEKTWLEYDNHEGTLPDTTINFQICHVRSYELNYLDGDEPYEGVNYTLVYDAPVKATNIENNRMLIDQRMDEMYGHIFVIDPHTFDFAGTIGNNIIINTGTTSPITYKMKSGGTSTTGSTLYVYSDQYIGKVYILSFTSPNEVTVTLNPGPTATEFNLSGATSGYTYGLDEWDISTNEQDITDTSSFNRVDIDIDSDRNSLYDMPTKLPSPWKINDPVYVITDNQLNYIKKDSIPGTIFTIKRIVEDWIGMYLYDNPPPAETAETPNIYLYDNIDQYLFNETYLLNSGDTYELTGVDVEFTEGVIKNIDSDIIEGTCVRANTIINFKKSTRLYQVNTSVANLPNGIDNNAWFDVRYDDNFFVSKWDSNNFDPDNIWVQTYMDSSFTGITNSGTSYLIESPAIGIYGKAIEILPFISDNKLIPPTRPYNKGGVIGTSMYFYDENDTITGVGDAAVGTEFFIKSDGFTGPATLIVSKSGTYTGYRELVFNKIFSSKKGYIYEPTLIGKVDQCYRLLDLNNDGYPANYGDPSLPITNSAKYLLRDVNMVLETDTDNFERKAGLSIKSFNLGDQDTSVFSNEWNGGNFYSGNFYGIWRDGNWFSDDDFFRGLCFSNLNVPSRQTNEAPLRSRTTILNMNELINSLIKKKEYYISPPWDKSDKKEKTIVGPPIIRTQE